MSLKFAVIPWSDAGLHDNIFVIDDPEKNVDHRNEPFLDMKKEFERRGDSIHTVDVYRDLNEIDYFLFFELDWEWIQRIVRLGKADSMIYCNAEPPVVNPLNSPKGYLFLKHFFPYILTWNTDWVDNETIFQKNIPYFFETNFGQIPFSDRKLLTSISGNKKSPHPDELYSERERAIIFFENNYPDDFDFYGTGWSAEGHPCYRGRVDNKAETYHKYRFAICYENMKNIKGYVTEKILDCLTSGIVPIYAGATDIRKYVPEDCFIDFFSFSDYQELALYLKQMDEETYNGYLEAAQSFLHSDLQDKFSGQEYARDIYNITNQSKNFKISLLYRNYVSILLIKRKVASCLKRWIKNDIFKKTF